MGSQQRIRNGGSDKWKERLNLQKGLMIWKKGLYLHQSSFLTISNFQYLKQISHQYSLPLRYGNSTRNYAVRVGDYHTLVPEEFEEEIGVQQIVIHREYRPDSSDYDIALVRLQGPEEQCARFSSHVLPACLPFWRERPQKTASNCYITGWGDTGKAQSKKKAGTFLCLVLSTYLGVQWAVRS